MYHQQLLSLLHYYYPMQFIQAYIYIYTGIVDVNQSIMIVCVSFAQYIIMHVDYNIIAIYIIINI